MAIEPDDAAVPPNRGVMVHPSTPRANWYYLLTLAALIGTTLLLLPFRDHLSALDVALIYLIAITALSLRGDTLSGILVSVLAFLGFDFFFIPPFYTLSVARPDHVLVLAVFLGIALLTSELVVRVRSRTEEALRRGEQTESLYDLSTSLLGESNLADMIASITERTAQFFSLDTCLVLLDEGGRLVPHGEHGERGVSGASGESIERLLPLAREAMTQRRVLSPDGAGGEGEPAHTMLVPIATARRSFGVLVAGRHDPHPAFDTSERRLLETFANQAAIAFERSVLTEEQTRAEILTRSDQLKSALLSAVSHDLRTPLASIKASATTLLQEGISLPEEDRHELLQAIDEEADRLNGLVANLLDLSRIEAGALRPALEWCELSEVVYAAADRGERTLRCHPLTVALPEPLPPIHIDFVLVVQVILNLLENATKYSPAGSPVTVSARASNGWVTVSVRDEGSGIPAGEEERIFDKFYRIEARNRPIGSGIGLAICRGFVEAHGGRIWAEHNPERGATIRFTIPSQPGCDSPKPQLTPLEKGAGDSHDSGR